MFWQPAHIHFKYKPSFLAVLVFIAIALIAAFTLYYVEGNFSKILFAVTGIIPIFAVILFDRQRQLGKALTADAERRKACEANEI